MNSLKRQSNNKVKRHGTIDKEYPHVSEYYDVFIDIIKHFSSNKTMNKIELLKIIPAYLNKPNTTKYKLISKWNKNVSQKEFEDVIMTLTTGSDYPSFDYMVIKYDLKIDNNNMIIFTEEFPFNNKIKKEPLFIWSILNSIKNHPLLCNFLDKLKPKLQSNCESDLIASNHKMEYDIHFPELDIIVEIDENHKSNVFYNDIVKNIISSMNGYVLFRLDFQKIYCDITYKDGKRIYYGKGEIRDEIANKYLLNSEYYAEFIKFLTDNICYSLLSRLNSFRENYILYLLDISLNEKIKELEETINYNISKKDSYDKLINENKNLATEYLSNIKEITWIIEKNYKSIKD